MISGKVVTYYRVSTAKQGLSGLGLDAQKDLVTRYLNGVTPIAEFTEVESGKNNERPQLRAALEMCKKKKATLVIAKLDRLSRSTAFVSSLIEAGTDFVAADNPHANKVMLQMFSVMAEWERDQISARTKAALAAAKARGVKLGQAGFANLQPVIAAREQAANEFAVGLSRVVQGFLADGMTRRAIVDELNRLQIRTARGGAWSLTQVQRLITRINGLQQEEIKLAA
ncbi:putative phage resolvase/recombinase for integration and excision [Burkholderia cenocepacia]|uniref:Putative phage resolvase/recombinase for integration and excision n=1 Tax=Burkholderia cenocepacia TaxID=95486 RepID=A0A6J5JWH3_9BURK|nr:MULTISPECIES: recombinase family protein [Burkholderia cepacia complex]CAB3975909.1 putative phage resolvase/recombinase for integration and excision [Burkholderia cenocepacia]